MSNQPDTEKRVLSVRVKRELYAKIAKRARANESTISDFVSTTLYTATKNVELTPEEIEQIKKDTEDAKQSR